MNTLMHAVLLADGNGGRNDGDGSPWFFWVISPVLVIGGIVSAVRPDLVWRANRWQYMNRDVLEPSAAGLVMQRVIGVFVAGVGIAFMVIAATH